MSTTQAATTYIYSGGVGLTTSGGAQASGNMYIEVSAGSDFADADAFVLQEALLAAFPASWHLTNGDMPVTKMDTSSTQYVTDYTAKAFS
jgi:hypothetical protein